MKRFMIIFFTVLSASSVFANDVLDDIAKAIKAGDTKQIATYFSSTLELDLLGESKIYSASQAELTLKDFFAKHAPVTIKVLHKINSNVKYQFCVLDLKTNTGNFRISYEVQNNKDDFKISLFKIEENKE